MFGFGELAAAAVIVAAPVIPMATVRDLKLNAGQGVERLLTFLGASAENQNASLVVGLARNVAHVENQAKVSVVDSGENHSASGASAGHGAVFYEPRVG